MKKIFLVFVAFLVTSSMLTGIAMAKTKEIRINRAGYLDVFTRGDASLKPDHLRTIDGIVAYLEANPRVTLFLKGSVSREIIHGNCFVNDDSTYYSLHKSRRDTKELDGEEACEQALGYARAVAVKNKIISNGIDSSRIEISEGVDSGAREGDHSLNRAVSYWYLEVPPGTEFISSREDADGDLILAVKVPLHERVKEWWHNKIKRLKDRPRGRKIPADEPR